MRRVNSIGPFFSSCFAYNLKQAGNCSRDARLIHTGVQKLGTESADKWPGFALKLEALLRLNNLKGKRNPKQALIFLGHRVGGQYGSGDQLHIQGLSVLGIWP